ncbi:MAG: permease prefix domain 2-containing transporter, partial [Bacteroidota bacterium]
MKSHKHNPPKSAQHFLRWFLRDELAEEVEGDLEEKFYQTIEEYSIGRAKRNYWYQVFHYLRPFAIRNVSTFYNPNHYAMYRNYLKIGWRNLSKDTLYSSIKIGGLAIGMTACLLILLFIRDELSYDLQYPEGEHIYRTVGRYNFPGETIRDIHFPAPLASILTDQFPEVKVAGRLILSELIEAGSKQIRRADRAENIYAEGFAYADQEWLDILQPTFVYGDHSRALDEPNTIIISKSKADLFFPNENPLGKTLILNDNEVDPYTVNGVFEDLSAKSHLPFDFYMTLTGKEFWKGEQTSWDSFNYHTYLRVTPGSDVEKLEANISESIITQYILPTLQEAGQTDAEEFVNQMSIRLQPVSSIYLHSAGIQDGLNHGDIRFVWLFGVIAGFILIIACINFVNLSTAKSANRAKEIGLRKVVGSLKRQLIDQFLTESVLFSLFSLGLALVLSFLLLPFFNELTAKPLTLSWGEWWLFPLLGLAAIVIGILAGLYPAFYLSRFQPVQVLKGGLGWGYRRTGSKNSKLRSTLVVFQFITSMILIISTIIIYQQIQF